MNDSGVQLIVTQIGSGWSTLRPAGDEFERHPRGTGETLGFMRLRCAPSFAGNDVLHERRIGVIGQHFEFESRSGEHAASFCDAAHSLVRRFYVEGFGEAAGASDTIESVDSFTL